MSLKVKELTQKYWAMVSDLLCRTLITQECCTILKGNRPLPMKCRTRLYIVGVLLGALLLSLFFLPLLLLWLYFPFFKENEVLQSALIVLILTFPSVTINWFIKNRDTSRQLKDSSKQLEYSLQQQNETLFSNSLQLLFKKEDGIANSVGLKELVKLKQEERIDSERVDLITSLGLRIEKAKLLWAELQEAELQEADLQEANLQRANLQGTFFREANLREANLQRANLREANLREANLQRANLQGANLQEAYLRAAKLQRAELQRADLREANLQRANLQGADLQGANLQGANLQGTNLEGANLYRANLYRANLEDSRYDEKTVFPNDRFDPKQHGMKLIKSRISESLSPSAIRHV